MIQYVNNADDMIKAVELCNSEDIIVFIEK